MKKVILGGLAVVTLFVVVFFLANIDKLERSGRRVESDPALAEIDEFIRRQEIVTSSRGWKSRLPKPPRLEFDESTEYYWVLDTSVGRIVIELFPKEAPMHVSSTVFLTRVGYYDGLTFHRVVSGMMAQGGCPNGDGRGGPGYRYQGEFSSRLSHQQPGIVSAANTGPGTDGGQFFITFAPTPWLDPRHTIFGRVVEGMEGVRKIEAAGSRTGIPTKKIIVREAEIQAD